MKAMSLANKLAVLGVIVGVLSIVIPLVKGDPPKDQDKPSQDVVKSQPGVSADNQSVVIQGNTGTISFGSDAKKDATKQ